MVTAARWEAHVEKAFCFPSDELIFRIAVKMNAYDTTISVEVNILRIVAKTKSTISLMLVSVQERDSKGGTSQKKWLMILEPQKES